MISLEAWRSEFAALPRPPLPPKLARLMAQRRYLQAHLAAAPGHRLSIALDVIAKCPNVEAWPRLLALAIAAGDWPRREHRRLSAVVRLLHRLRLPIVDCEDSRAALDALPDRLTVYRGTVRAEFDSGDLGICWTLDREAAERFATRAVIAQWIIVAAQRPDVGEALAIDLDSPAALLSTEVSRDDLAGMLTRLGEQEVLICSDRLTSVEVTPFIPTDSAGAASKTLTLETRSL